MRFLRRILEACVGPDQGINLSGAHLDDLSDDSALFHAAAILVSEEVVRRADAAEKLSAAERVHRLAIVGALIAGEIDRRLRLAPGAG